MCSGQLKGAVGQFKNLLGVQSGVPDYPHVRFDFNLQDLQKELNLMS